MYKSDFEHNVNLLKLYLSDNVIESLDDHSFVNNEHLTYLDLRRNRIKTLSQDIFDGLDNLKFLLLDSNNIASIHEMAFSSLCRLVSISISHNKIQNLSPDVFKGLHKIQYLNLAENYRVVVQKCHENNRKWPF